MMSKVEERLEDIKKHRDDMVARNYPFQQITNLIDKWEESLRKDKKEDKRRDKIKFG